MSDNTLPEDFAEAWNEFKRKYWDSWSTLTDAGPAPEWNEALNLQLRLLEQLADATLKLRCDCIRSGLRGLTNRGAPAPVSSRWLDEVRSQLDGWIESEQRVFSTWLEDVNIAYASGEPTSVLQAAAKAAVEIWHIASARLLSLQAAWLKAQEEVKNARKQRKVPPAGRDPGRPFDETRPATGDGDFGPSAAAPPLTPVMPLGSVARMPLTFGDLRRPPYLA